MQLAGPMHYQELWSKSYYVCTGTGKLEEQELGVRQVLKRNKASSSEAEATTGTSFLASPLAVLIAIFSTVTRGQLACAGGRSLDLM